MKFPIGFDRREDPADVDRNILDVARRLDTYGITLYPCRVSSTCKIITSRQTSVRASDVTSEKYFVQRSQA
jgi:hypothetical protein